MLKLEHVKAYSCVPQTNHDLFLKTRPLGAYLSTRLCINSHLTVGFRALPLHNLSLAIALPVCYLLLYILEQYLASEKQRG